MRAMSARKTANAKSSSKKSTARSARGKRGSAIGTDVLWITLGLLAGALLIPPLIWVTGLIIIGPYANGGLWALWTDLIQSLQDGSWAAWVTLLAPATLAAIWRISWRWLTPR
jgi:hypothetical protein